MTYIKHEKRLDTFHMKYIHCILGLLWKKKVPKTEVPSHVAVTTMFTLLRQCRLQWLGYVHCIEDGQILKEIFYRELANGNRVTGHPHLCYRDPCKRDMKVLEINSDHGRTLMLTILGGELNN